EKNTQRAECKARPSEQIECAQDGRRCRRRLDQVLAPQPDQRGEQDQGDGETDVGVDYHLSLYLAKRVERGSRQSGGTHFPQRAQYQNRSDVGEYGGAQRIERLRKGQS